jgi:Tol biopolymer transport system component
LLFVAVRVEYEETDDMCGTECPEEPVDYYSVRRTRPGGGTARFRDDGRAPAVSFESRRVAYNSHGDIFVAPLTGPGDRQITPTSDETFYGEPAWAPDGRALAVDRGSVSGYGKSICTLSAAGGPIRRLTSGYGPAWSARNQIAFARDEKRRKPGSRFTASYLWVMDATGHKLTQVTHGPVSDALPSFSPDGTKLAFQRQLRVKHHWEKPEIWVIAADGTAAHRVLGDAGQPTWSPDGDRLAFVRDGDVWVADAAGRNARRMLRASRLHADRLEDPIWTP